jgi:hypothetical protein
MRWCVRTATKRLFPQWNCAFNAIAARVIVGNATGHKYWSRFSDELGTAMETIGGEIFSILFYPPLETPVKTPNLPIAGKSGQALPLIFDLVNLANGVPVVDVKKLTSATFHP